MSKKYFVFSDIHGFSPILERALCEAGFDKDNDEHIIISCGDLFDRGHFNRECLEFIMKLPKHRRLLVRGNHEDLLEQLINRGYFEEHDFHNGTDQTVADLAMGDFNSSHDAITSLKQNQLLISYLNELKDFIEFENYIFVHGWIPCDTNDPNMYHARKVHYSFNEDWREGDWDRARWMNGMDAWRQGVRIEGKTIVCGHWHTSWAHSKIHKLGPEWDNPYSTNPEHQKAHFEPFLDDGIAAIDGCTAYSHRVNVITIEEQ